MVETILTIHALKKWEKYYETVSAKMDEFSCQTKKLLVLWPDPSFLKEENM